jgi:hypothetical protein
LKPCIITRKQLYGKQWTTALSGLDFACVAPLPKAIAAVLNEIAKELEDGRIVG